MVRVENDLTEREEMFAHLLLDIDREKGGYRFLTVRNLLEFVYAEELAGIGDVEKRIARFAALRGTFYSTYLTNILNKVSWGCTNPDQYPYIVQLLGWIDDQPEYAGLSRNTEVLEEIMRRKLPFGQLKQILQLNDGSRIILTRPETYSLARQLDDLDRRDNQVLVGLGILLSANDKAAIRDILRRLAPSENNAAILTSLLRKLVMISQNLDEGLEKNEDTDVLFLLNKIRGLRLTEQVEQLFGGILT